MPLSRLRQHTIYKCFIQPHLDYGDAGYDQIIISKIIESIRYKAALVITEAIKESSREKPDHEVGLQHLHNMRWMRCLCLFYKDFQIRVLKYAHSFIPTIRFSSR